MTTSRIGFRCWSEADLPFARGLWGDLGVTRFIGGPFSEEQIKARVIYELEMHREHGMQYWPIFLLGSGDHLGCAGLRPHTPEGGILELGVHLRPQFWRYGLGEEAAQAVIEFAFSRFHPAALFAGHHPDNDRSKRLLNKLGFLFTHEELYPPTGRCHPSYLLTPVIATGGQNAAAMQKLPIRPAEPH